MSIDTIPAATGAEQSSLTGHARRVMEVSDLYADEVQAFAEESVDGECFFERRAGRTFLVAR